MTLTDTQFAILVTVIFIVVELLFRLKTNERLINYDPREKVEEL